MFTTGRLHEAVRDALLEAWAVLLPTECSGCGRPDRALCAGCRAALQPEPRAALRDDLTVWSALDYTEVTGRVLVAYKDGGRTDAGPALAAALGAAVAAAVAVAVAVAAAPGAALPAPAAPARPGTGSAGILLVTVPSTRRAWRLRGFHPVDRLLGQAGLRPTPLLRQSGRILDQVGLGQAERLDNRRGSLIATRSLTGSRIILVDDIVTTGATLLEARRALTLAGGDVLAAATVAHTRRHHPALPASDDTH